MSKNQLIKYLAYLENLEGQNFEKVIRELQIYSERENHMNTYFVKQFVKEQKKG
jgi:predicted RNA-binding protein